MNKINPLPTSENEFWDGEKLHCEPHPINICPTHTKETWMTHKGYKLNAEGGIECMFCSWGARIPGYMRLINGVIVDLRTLNKS